VAASNKPNIAVIVPTIREDRFKQFLDCWFPLFKKHDVLFVVVWDGDDPSAMSTRAGKYGLAYNFHSSLYSTNSLRRGELSIANQELFSDHNPACRNLGFFSAARDPDVNVFMTFDDDCLPIGDPIEAHLHALSRRWPMSWFGTADHGYYMRGFPYAIRGECEAVVSHGLWHNNPDFDAPSELQAVALKAMNRTSENREEGWYVGPIPRGVFYPHCGMNVAFTREMLPYYYHCPVEDFPGAERFDDIWMGIELKKAIDKMENKCVVSGVARVEHTRASNPFTNLAKEAVGIHVNETLWKGDIDKQYQPFFDLYRERRERYEQLLKALV
jgi:reversibly glycosylated polypeptide / UDP-arabinopyranose mutase